MNKRIKKKKGKIRIATAKDIYSLIDDHFIKCEQVFIENLPICHPEIPQPSQELIVRWVKIIHNRILEKISKGFLEVN